MLKSTLYHWLKSFRRQAKPNLQGGVTIKARSIYILPTKQGLLLAMVIILMLVGSINYGSNLGHLVTFLLAGIWLINILHTWRNLLGLKLQPLRVASVFACESADFTLTLINPSTLDRFGLSLKHKKRAGDCVDISGNEQLTVHLPLPTHRRGEFLLPEVTLHTTYPLGLFHAWSYAQLDLICLVYPKPAEQGEPPFDTSYTSSDMGDRGVGTDDFIGLRNFRSGDSPKHINWKAYAKQQGLLSKQFGGDRHVEVRLDWDLIVEQEPERRLSLLCRYVIQQEELGHAYSLHIPGTSIPSGLGSAHMQRCLTALARYGDVHESS
ncbi:MAG: DUF58 domain-containing protein [Candidatus Thiodiazotropha sp.]|jgi:uncharacterized protein (DUF58 family)